MKQYETVIGLEVHVELATKTKIFCGCSTEFGGAPNTHTCPVCTGMPGSLPVLNKKVVEFALKAGLAANCQINQYCKFDRKNYFYPDNPQNYQISQLYLPICHDGWVEIETSAGKKKIRILRLMSLQLDLYGDDYTMYSLDGEWGREQIMVTRLPELMKKMRRLEKLLTEKGIKL